ncbi:MAG: hypothetical protein LBO66_04365 [Deltaproteobacteria bacterium]|jgi:hypothetical protein|nr:hypothetical protein [Deltaproteobacteria bacterium]
MAYLHISKIRGVDYIYGGVSYRDPVTGSPQRDSVCLGKIDSITREPIYNGNYAPWIDKNKKTIKRSLEEYALEKRISLNVSRNA